MLVTRSIPSRFRDSRTVLIPKSGDLSDPLNYRPISVASVVLRHFHKILAKRLSSLDIFDVRQRAFISADGCAKNVAILSALMDDARTKRKEVHIVSLDVRKAFDTISHDGIYEVLLSSGLPISMVEYIKSLYSASILRIEVDGAFSGPIRPGRGVRQGDPLSPLIFNLIMNVVIASVPDQVGYDFSGSRVSVLAFADDLLIIGSSREGTQRSLDKVQATLGHFGLELAPAKCVVFSLVPVGKIKKIKVVTEAWLRAGEYLIPQLKMLDTVRYLGVDFDHRGLAFKDVKLLDRINYLDRITRAPLKPQQRIWIVRKYLIPRFIHGLVLGRYLMPVCES